MRWSPSGPVLGARLQSPPLTLRGNGAKKPVQSGGPTAVIAEHGSRTSGYFIGIGIGPGFMA
ncbi:MAG: hypothetical protein QGI34_17640 [Candidatus Latescibacteria bacterium]|nr:hypothetical protein [Candidatus Latescibacterota bacterium]